MHVHEQWDEANAPVYGVMVVGGLAGLWVGNLLAPRLDGPCFQRCLTFFLAMVKKFLSILSLSVHMCAWFGFQAELRRGRGSKPIVFCCF